MWIVGLLMMLSGSLILTGEYLCVEVAWRCLDYNQFYITLGTLLLGTGLITTMIGSNDA